MFVRAVRFTGVTQERVDAVVARIEESDGPPPGVPATAGPRSRTVWWNRMFSTIAVMLPRVFRVLASKPPSWPWVLA